MNRINIGHGVEIEKRYVDGEFHGVAYWHECNGIYREDWVHVQGLKSWTLITLDPLTITPSLLCRVCGHHGFITNGKWVPS